MLNVAFFGILFFLFSKIYWYAIVISFVLLVHRSMKFDCHKLLCSTMTFS